MSSAKAATLQPSVRQQMDDFDFFLRRNRGLLMEISKKHRAMGILDDQDIFQEAYLAWHEARENYDPAYGASFLRFAISKIEISLHKQHRILRRGGIPTGTDDYNDDIVRESHIATHTETTVDIDSAEDQELLYNDDDTEPPITDLDAELTIACFLHSPIYQKHQYRELIDAATQDNKYSPSDGAFAKDLSESLQLTRRRIHQIQNQMCQEMFHPNLKRTNEMLKKNASERVPVTLHYLDTANLRPMDPCDDDRMHQINASIRAQQQFTLPVLVDQFLRVLDGAQRVHAAKHLGIVAIPVIIQVLSGSENLDDDPVFWNTRSHYTRCSTVHSTRSRRKPVHQPRTNTVSLLAYIRPNA